MIKWLTIKFSIFYLFKSVCMWSTPFKPHYDIFFSKEQLKIQQYPFANNLAPQTKNDS